MQVYLGKRGAGMKQKDLKDIGICRNIGMLRSKARMTQEYVAIQMQTMGIKMSRSRFSMIELGRERVSVTMLVALKIIFKCSYDDLFEGLENNL